MVICDECGAEVLKLHRVYKEHGFCTKCYSRQFKKLICQGCNTVAVLLKRDPKALCRDCERLQPCIRCGRKGLKIGKLTREGPVCNSCSIYFRKVRKCPRCGKKTRVLSRVSRLGITEQVCRKCQRADHATCPLCKKHRLLVSSETGNLICRKCKDVQKKPCHICRELMVGGRENKCESCYWQELLAKRIQMNCEIFYSFTYAQLFEQFSEWLGQEVGAHKAAITINKYVDFFVELSKLCEGLTDYKKMVFHFSPLVLRRNMLPMRFLENSKRVTVSEEIKNEAAEQYRIEKIISRITVGHYCRDIVDLYHKKLLGRYKAGKIKKLSSVRLALHPAVALLMCSIENRKKILTQEDLDLYLKKVPGQRNALSGFVGFLKNECSVELELPEKRKCSAYQNRKRLERELMVLLGSKQSKTLDLKKLIILLLKYFHSFSESEAKKVVSSVMIVKNEQHVVMQVEGKKYHVPQVISEFFN